MRGPIPNEIETMPAHREFNYSPQLIRRSKRRLSDTASAVSVNTDGLQLVAPGVRDGSFPAIGQHDRGAVGGMEREQL